MRDGERVNNLMYAKATCVDPNAAEYMVWRTGTVIGPGELTIDLPEGPLFFTLDVTGIGNNENFVALGEPFDGEELTLHLPGTGIELVGPTGTLHGPPPIATLIEEHPGTSEASLRAILHKARRRGLLTSAPSGQAGGALTPLAIRLLQDHGLRPTSEET